MFNRKKTNGLTRKEARKRIKAYAAMDNPTEGESARYEEALVFLLARENKIEDMLALGGYSLQQQQVDRAISYYQMAEERGSGDAAACLGDLWYYGQMGMRDVQKAHAYYARGMERGSIHAAYMAAEMIKAGDGVEQDEKKYAQILESLYPTIRKTNKLWEPLPEVFLALAGFRREQQRTQEAISMLRYAKIFLGRRMVHGPSLWNLQLMQEIVETLYQLTDFNARRIDLYDLFSLFTEPAKVTFSYQGRPLVAEALFQNGELVIRYEEEIFPTRQDFFARACVDGVLLTSVSQQLTSFC